MYMDSTVEHLEDFAKEGKLTNTGLQHFVKSSVSDRTFSDFPINDK